MINKLRDAKLLCQLFGITFTLVAALGFIPNPIVSETGIFAVNLPHNLIHALTGILFFAGAALGHSEKTILGIGVLYAVVAVLGFAMPGDMLLGFVHNNMADKLLHLVLAVVIIGAGLWVKK